MQRNPNPEHQRIFRESRANPEKKARSLLHVEGLTFTADDPMRESDEDKIEETLLPVDGHDHLLGGSLQSTATAAAPLNESDADHLHQSVTLHQGRLFVPVVHEVAAVTS